MVDEGKRLSAAGGTGVEWTVGWAKEERGTRVGDEIWSRNQVKTENKSIFSSIEVEILGLILH